eukprot:6185508-Pleurochrysis_carterae.AAC.5
MQKKTLAPARQRAGAKEAKMQRKHFAGVGTRRANSHAQRIAAAWVSCRLRLPHTRGPAFDSVEERGRWTPTLMEVGASEQALAFSDSWEVLRASDAEEVARRRGTLGAIFFDSASMYACRG